MAERYVLVSMSEYEWQQIAQALSSITHGPKHEEYVVNRLLYEIERGLKRSENVKSETT